MLRKRASVHATSLRARPVAEKAAIVAAVRGQVWPLIAAGEIRPVIDVVLPLADAGQAHRLMEAGGHVGKILLAGITNPPPVMRHGSGHRQTRGHD